MFHQLNNNLLKIITDFIDYDSLTIHFEKTCKKYKFLLKKLPNCFENRIKILNNNIGTPLNESNTNKIYNIICDEINTIKFNEIILTIINNTFIQKFLIDLLKTNLFFIGGSFALIFAHVLYNKDINLEKYDEFDIDIFPIGIISPNQSDIIQSTLQTIINNCFVKNKSHYIDCLIINNNFVTNIYFPKILNIPKIQIILHNKSTIDEHIAFIDLPITHFTIGYQKIFYTEIAKYAFDYKICIIDKVYNKQTVNRILKYSNRGFLIVKNGKHGCDLLINTRIIAVYSLNYIYKVDCYLSDIIKLQNNMKNNIFKNKLPPRTNVNIKIIGRTPGVKILFTKTINNLIHETICKYLYNMNLLKYYIDNIDNDNYYDIYFIKRKIKNEHDEYEFFNDYLLTKKVINNHYSINKMNTYRYKNNDRKYIFYNPYTNKSDDRSYEKYLDKYNNSINKHKYFPYFTILKPEEFINIKKNIFFTIYNSYFLNNHEIKITITNNYSHVCSSEKEKIVYIPNWKHKGPIIDDEGFILIKKK